MKMLTHTYKIGFTTQYEYIKHAKAPKFTVLYTHGLCSDPWGSKPENVKQWCVDNNIDFYRYELAGHGSDKVKYPQCSPEEWRQQILEIVDTQIQGPILVVGSSLGGWLSMMAAIDRPQRIIGFIGLAAAPDFTYHLRDYLSPEQNKELDETGQTAFDNADFGYFYTLNLIEGGNKNLIAQDDSINISCPVHWIHGMKDASIPYWYAVDIVKKITSDTVMLKLLKESNHRLNDELAATTITYSLNWYLHH